MLALAKRLRAEAAGFALRFLGAFVAAALLWSFVAPVYAATLAGAGGLFASIIAPGDRYESDGPKVSAVRPLGTEPDGRTREARQGLWSAAVTWNTPLFIAAILATRRWPWPRRWRALALGSGVLALGHLIHLLVNAAFTAGRLHGAEPGVTTLALEWLSGFFDIVLMPVLPVAVYLVLASGRLGLDLGEEAAAGVSRNAACPCGSGIKYKRCCGRD